MPSKTACATSGPFNHNTASARCGSPCGSKSANDWARAVSQTDGLRVAAMYALPPMEADWPVTNDPMAPMIRD